MSSYHPTSPPTPSPVPPAVPQAPRSGLALAGLVLAIIGIFLPLFGIAGLICGIVAVVNIPRAAPRRGMAIAAIICGAIGFFTSAGAAVGVVVYRESTQRMDCLKNMRSAETMLIMYSFDHNGWAPPDLRTATDYFQQRAAAAGTSKFDAAIIRCPSGDARNPQTYKFPGASVRLIKIKHPGEQVILYDTLGSHRGGICVGFADGHVEWVPQPRAAALIKAVESGQNPPGMQRP